MKQEATLSLNGPNPVQSRLTFSILANFLPTSEHMTEKSTKIATLGYINMDWEVRTSVSVNIMSQLKSVTLALARCAFCEKQLLILAISYGKITWRLNCWKKSQTMEGQVTSILFEGNMWSRRSRWGYFNFAS